MTLLRIERLGVRFGGLVAVKGLDLDVRKGEIHGLIGPNGAGKTTVFNVISRLYEAQDGVVRFAGADLLALEPHEIAPLGIARTFQNIELFRTMTVLDNALAGRHAHMRGGVVAAGIAARAAREEERRARDEAMVILRRLELEALADQEAGTLAFGHQRLLELARALASRPKLLLLDEPAAGMNTRETQEFDRLLLRLRDELELSILLVEHDMRVIMGISDRVTVMHHGQRIAVGTPEEIRTDPRVIEAYLGPQATHAPAQ